MKAIGYVVLAVLVLALPAGSVRADVRAGSTRSVHASRLPVSGSAKSPASSQRRPAAASRVRPVDDGDASDMLHTLQLDTTDDDNTPDDLSAALC